jgi:hypothetical protein
MRIEYRFEGPPSANGVAPYVSERSSDQCCQDHVSQSVARPGDLLKVFRKTEDGEVFIGHLEHDTRERLCSGTPRDRRQKGLLP